MSYMLFVLGSEDELASKIRARSFFIPQVNIVDVSTVVGLSVAVAEELILSKLPLLLVDDDITGARKILSAEEEILSELGCTQN